LSRRSAAKAEAVVRNPEAKSTGHTTGERRAPARPIRFVDGTYFSLSFFAVIAVFALVPTVDVMKRVVALDGEVSWFDSYVAMGTPLIMVALVLPWVERVRGAKGLDIVVFGILIGLVTCGAAFVLAASDNPWVLTGAKSIDGELPQNLLLTIPIGALFACATIVVAKVEPRGLARVVLFAAAVFLADRLIWLVEPLLAALRHLIPSQEQQVPGSALIIFQRT
jgi:hypothetical protein